MALAPSVAGVEVHSRLETNTLRLQASVLTLFFTLGGLTSLNDVLIPKLKGLFSLNFTQAMMVQFCFFAAYAITGIPASMIVKRIGYLRGAVAGLLTMTAGCLLFIPASLYVEYPLFLMALFVLAGGVVMLQVVANPLITFLGKSATMHSRLTFAQAFNSLGTTIFPTVGAMFLLDRATGAGATGLNGAELAAYRATESISIVHGYLFIAAILVLFSALFWFSRNQLGPMSRTSGSVSAGFRLLLRPRFRFGVICIFLYVGAEVSIGSLIVSYLTQEHVLAISERSAGALIGMYWMGAMFGRFAGSAVLRVIRAGTALSFAGLGAIVLLAVSMGTNGAVSGYSLLLVGLMNSIMFPTIFSLASEGLGEQAAEASGILNVAIVGGAVVPLMTGFAADHTSLTIALLLPMTCYGVIALFGARARQGSITCS